MNKKITISIIILIIIAALAYLALSQKTADTGVVEPIATTTATETVATTTDADTTVSNGIITFSTPADFGLALNKDQITVSSYIPPCSESFDYCLYYNGGNYMGSNFESAGLAIRKREDLKTVKTCLNTAPESYKKMSSTLIASTTLYSVGVFRGIGDAGAGHYASGDIYRLAYDGTCHEFETRVGASQYANFPAGSIKEFSKVAEDEIKLKLKDILANIVLSSGDKANFGK